MDPEMEARLAAIIERWLAEREQGMASDPESLYRAHPDLADDLRERCEAFSVLDHLFQDEPDGWSMPQRLGRYRIVAPIGRGAMGIVYRARDEELQRDVAVKVLLPGFSSHPEAVSRFYREARAAARLHHPHIVAIHEIGRGQQHLFFAMDLVEGRSLKWWLDQQRLRAGENVTPLPSGVTDRCGWIVDLFLEVADALDAAHCADVIHRDIKPSNILIDIRGHASVGDFGLARIVGQDETLTASGEMVGTLQYMSPEQARAIGKGVDARSDIYSLGATMYECLTLRPPHAASDAGEMIAKIIRQEPLRPSRIDAGLPRDLETIALKAMTKEREHRYQTAAEFRQDLSRFQRHEPILAHHTGPAGRLIRRARRRPFSSAALVAVGLLVATLAWALLRSSGGPARIDLSSLFPPGTTERHRTAIVLPERGLATAIAVEVPDGTTTRPDLGFFDQRNRPLWRASERWNLLEDDFGVSRARIRAMTTLIASRGETGPRESLLVVTYTRQRDTLWIFDVLSRASPRRWRYPGVYGGMISQGPAIVVVPSGGERRLLAVGYYNGAASRAESIPCLSLLDGEAREIQRFLLPARGLPQKTWPTVIGVESIWNHDPPLVTAVTSEAVYVQFPVIDGRLDPTRANVSLGDNFRNLCERNNLTEMVERLATPEGRRALLDELAGEISSVDLP